MPGQKEQAAPSSITLDKKDFEILRLLQDNAKLTFRYIAACIFLIPTPKN
jgi:DNA-binding Lrp family transcriptional regulator